MKKKLIVISSIVVGVIAILLTLTFTLFTVKNISFSSHNKIDYDTSSIEIKKGGVVFFLDKEQMINDIEQNNPKINVINIETVFPNSLVVHFAVREETYAIFDSVKNSYYIVDNEMIVLRILNTTQYTSTQTNAIEVTGLSITNQTVETGDKLYLRDNENILKNLNSDFLLCNRDVSEQCALIKKIELFFDTTQETLTSDGNVLTLYTFDDFKIIVYAPSIKLTQKVQVLLAGLPSCIPDYLDTHYLEILEDSDGEVFCKLSLKN